MHRTVSFLAFGRGYFVVVAVVGSFQQFDYQDVASLPEVQKKKRKAQMQNQSALRE